MQRMYRRIERRSQEAKPVGAGGLVHKQREIFS